MISSVTKLQRGPCLKLIFSLKDGNQEVSEEFNIKDLAQIRFKFGCVSSIITYSVSWKKHESAAADTVKLYVTCDQLQYSQQSVCTENFTDWIKMGEKVKYQSSSLFSPAFEVSLIVTKMETMTFAKLYEEEDFCDFNLMAIDDNASVPVHKACLIVHSEMFKRMLLGEWNEKKNGCIEIKGVTLQTIKHLKEYIYLGTLPDDSLQLQHLLLLARYYMMDNLWTECATKLALTVKPANLYSLQEFAVDNQISDLLHVILQITPDQTVQTAHQMENEKKVDAAQD